MRMPVVFFGHGSPMVAIEANRTSRSWSELTAGLPRPRAILGISAYYHDAAAARLAASMSASGKMMFADLPPSSWAISSKP